MNCARCGKANREGARFCDGCGASLAPRCAACGAEGRSGAAFCDSCGASLAAKPAPEGEVRKVVTIVFADLIGSTSLHERLDPESVSRVMDHYYRAVRAPIEAHGGTVVQLLGDGVMCAFGVPRVAEDDAIRAVRAAVAMQEAFRAFARAERDVVGSVGLRVAVNTGEVVVTDERAAGIGDPLNVAARLQQEARDGDVLIGEATERFVRELVTLEPVGTFALRGRSETVRAFRVLSLERPGGVATAAFVGRDDELRRLLAVYESAVGTPAARLAAILGSPGVGKSRLLAELARRLGAQATMLGARCDAAGGGTFAPLADALREHLGLPDAAGREGVRAAAEALVPGDESARIAAGVAALLAGTPPPPEETFFVVRRLLGAIAATRPVVLAIDDVQWAEPLLLDLIEHLVQWSTATPLLVLVAARPELRDARSSLAAPGGLVAAVVALGGLDAGAATRLAANVIGADELPAAIAGRVLATSEGNPLFVGELVRMLVHDGVLRREGDRWTTSVELASFEMPPTIHALLAARIERLRPAERTVLERAAVVGRQFSRAAVANLLPADIADLDARLETLRRSELIEPDTGWLLGEPVMRFHHVLIRDAAYRRVLKGTRAELHARFADWLAARSGEAIEHDETLGWHLEQAHQHLRELGPIDAKGRALGERAARHLGAAGRRALARDDLPLAASLLGRALTRLDAEDPARPDLALEWCEALLSGGDVGPAAAAIDEVGRLAAGSDRLRAWHTCFAGQRAVLTDPQALRPTADAVAAAAEALAAAGDTAGEAKAHAVQADALGRLGEFGACEAALDRALAAARRAHDRRRANAVLAGAPVAALWGPSPVTRASGRCLDVVRVLRITQGAPAVEAVALRCQAVLEALRGRTEAARRMIAASRRMVEELGITQRLLEADMFAGIIELLEGDATAAEPFLRGAYEGLRRQGLRVDAAHAAALLGRALLAAGRAADAEALSHESEALAGDDLKAAIAWRGVRAEALARRGDHTTAVTLAREAVDIAARLDALLDHADARLALAAALRAAGRAGEAAAEEQRAIALWEAKGATLLAERARRDVTRVVSLPPAENARAAATGGPLRRPRANAATAFAARLDAVVAARDEAGLSVLLAPGYQNVHHPTGVTYDREGSLTRWRALVRAENPTFVHTPLATLGDSLALCRRTLSLDALDDDDLAPFGPVELDQFVVLEVDAEGGMQQGDVYALDHLGDAIARLYERYAELLPEGPAQPRAATTAHTVAAMLGPLDPDRWSSVAAPAIDLWDHRTLGYPSGRVSPTQWAEVLRVIYETADDLQNPTDEILDLRADALLVRRTTSGTDRRSGGPFERTLITLWGFGADGFLARYELFDVDRTTEALARFDEVVGEAPASRDAPPSLRGAVCRRVRPNAASANAARLDAAVAARDAGALDALIAASSDTVHHPTQTVYDRRGALSTWRSLIKATDATLHHEVLATLGDSLAVCRTLASFSALAVDAATSFGPVTKDEIVLMEVDARGQRSRAEFFGADRLGDAVTRLYAWYADGVPDGPVRAPAVATARGVAAFVNVLDPDAVRENFSPSIESVDHSRLGLFGHVRGIEVFLRYVDVLHETGEKLEIRVDDVLDARPDGLLLRSTFSGVGRASGGAFDQQYLQIWLFGVDGRVVRYEHFDADQREQALRRFDALTAAPSAPRFSNAAVRAVERFTERWLAHDWDGAMATFAPVPWLDDRRPLIRLQLSGEEYFGHARLMFATSWTVWQTEVLATRGERLALFRIRTKGDYRGVETAADFLWLVEVDTQGRREGLTIFEVEDVEAAYAELDDRYAAGEGAPYAELLANDLAFRKASGERDWDTVARLLPVDFTLRSHRHLVGTATPIDRAEYLATRGRVEDLGVRGGIRVDHVPRLGPKSAVVAMTWYGTVDGGDFEDPFVCTYAHDGHTVHGVDIFDLDQLDAALARYEELSPAPGARFANVATRLQERVNEAWAARDWERMTATIAPTFRCYDRRPLVQLEMDRDGFLEFLRPLWDMSSRLVMDELIATRGDRLALMRMRSEAADASVGPTEIESLCLIEVNARGEQIALARFEVGDVDAAYAELDARYLAGEGAPHGAFFTFRDALARRDWDAFAAFYSPDLLVRDHRRLGWEETRGRDAFVRALRTLVDLAPDVHQRADHLTLAERAGLLVFTWVGTRDGGRFEDQRIIVTTRDDRGRVTRIDQYDADQLDAARARFAEVIAERGPRIENAATRAVDRVRGAWASRDPDRLAPLFAPGFQAIDRRKRVLLTVGREQFLENMWIEFPVSRLATDVIATRGNRLAMIRGAWQGSDGLTGLMEHEWVGIVEVDERGDHLAMVLFDTDDIDAAYAELDARYVAGEATAYGVQGPAFDHFLVRRDWDGLRRWLSPDLVVHDHRPLGWETLRGRDAYVESLKSLVQLAPDARIRFEHADACPRGGLVVATVFGTREGGSFEAPRVVVHEVDAQGRNLRFDFYNLDQLATARARYEAIRAGAPRDPLAGLVRPNAATAAMDGVQAAYEARDWAAMRAACRPDARIEDRRRRALLEYDVDAWIADRRRLADVHVRHERRPVACWGSRLAIERVLSHSGPPDGPIEVEALWLIEVDDAGLIAAFIFSDVDDLRATNREAWGRWFTHDAVAAAVVAPSLALAEALNDHDRAAARALLADDCVVQDHRLAGVGLVEDPDAYVASIAVLWELAPSIQFDTTPGTILHAAHGSVGVGHAFGTLPEGGAFESHFACLATVAGGRITRWELFELEQLDAALARFEALRPDPLRIPPNAVTRANDRLQQAFEHRDWEAVETLFAPALWDPLESTCRHASLSIL